MSDTALSPLQEDNEQDPGDSKMSPGEKGQGEYVEVDNQEDGRQNPMDSKMPPRESEGGCVKVGEEIGRQDPTDATVSLRAEKGEHVGMEILEKVRIASCLPLRFQRPSRE